MHTGCAPNTYQRIPHILTMNTSKQMIPRLQLPEAILEGKAQGYLTDPTSIQGQFLPFSLPGARAIRRFRSSTSTAAPRWAP